MGTSLDKVSRELSAMGAAAGTRLLELTDEISELLTCDIPNYAATTSSTSCSTRASGNVATMLRMFQHGAAPDQIVSPAAANEYAKRLAQCGCEWSRSSAPTGSATAASWCGVDEVAASPRDAELGTAVTARRVERHLPLHRPRFEQVLSTYQRERHRGLLTQTEVCAVPVARGAG